MYLSQESRIPGGPTSNTPFPKNEPEKEQTNKHTYKANPFYHVCKDPHSKFDQTI